jgi:prophage DNA circulation protein
MLNGASAIDPTMKRTIILSLTLLWLLSSIAGFSQAVSPAGTPAVHASSAYAANAAGPAASPQGAPVSYASVTALNGLLSQLETASKNTQSDLQKLRIERWKADGSSKKQSLAWVDSIQRNLQGALPEMITQLRSSPEDLPATFKVYRNLDALYDVLGSVTESAGAFGSKDDFQALSNDLTAFEGVRKLIAERLENLASSKEAEINRLRNDLRAAQAQVPTTPPKRTVVDDTEPPKKPAAKKKPVAKKPAITLAPGQTQTPPAQQQQPPSKPQ